MVALDNFRHRVQPARPAGTLAQGQLVAPGMYKLVGGSVDSVFLCLPSADVAWMYKTTDVCLFVCLFVCAVVVFVLENLALSGGVVVCGSKSVNALGLKRRAGIFAPPSW